MDHSNSFNPQVVNQYSTQGPTSPIEAESTNVSRTIDELDQAIAHLGMRLQAALAPSKAALGQSPDAKVSERVPTSPLRETLNNYAARIACLRSVVEDFSARIEL